MTNSVNKTESKETPINTIPSDGPEIDEFGYEKVVPKPEMPKPNETKPDETKDVTGYSDVKTPKPDETKDVTGYSDVKTPKPIETPKPDETKQTPEEESKKKIEEVLKNLPETTNKGKILEFATKHKMTKEQLEDYVNIVNEDNKQLIKEQETQLLQTRHKWREELLKDPDFGADSKETFDKNAFEVNKVLNNYMPNMKKVLTERGSVLPPYVMKDLLNISKIINPKTDFVNGVPSKSVDDTKSFLDTMYE